MNLDPKQNTAIAVLGFVAFICMFLPGLPPNLTGMLWAFWVGALILRSFSFRGPWGL